MSLFFSIVRHRGSGFVPYKTEMTKEKEFLWLFCDQFVFLFNVNMYERGAT